MDTSCSTTRVRASGRPAGPYSTRPETAIPCATRPVVPPSPASSARSARLGSELPEIFRIEVLEVVLQGIGIERPRSGLAARLARFHRGERQQTLAGEYRRLEPQRDGDRVRRPGVDLDHRVAAINVQLRVIGVLLDLRDDHLAQVRPQAEDDLFQ